MPIGDYKLDSILNTFQAKDDQYALSFIRDPEGFKNKLIKDPEMSNLYLSTKITYEPSKVLPLLGGLSLFASNAFRPKKVPQNGILTFKTVSSNGAFLIYENSCCNGGMGPTEHFMKVGLTDADYMEVEAVTLRLIEKLVPKQMHKYFLTYRASGNILVYKDASTDEISLNLKRYISTDHAVNFFGNSTINIPNTVIAPMLMARVVPGGVSLQQILTAWKHVTPSNDPKKIETIKDSLRLFHKSGIYDRSLNVPVLPDRIITTARAYILDKFNDFISAIIASVALLKFTHSDLHASNVLYDAATENFVMIDYGRAVVDLNASRVTLDFLMKEYQKLKSKPTHDVKPNILQANDFYKVFTNYGARLDFDSSDLAKYGIVLDLSSLSFVVFRDLKYRLEMPDHKLIAYSPFTNSIAVASLEEIRTYNNEVIADTNMVASFDMMLTYFALVLHAANESQITTDTIPVSSNGAFVIDFDAVMSYEPESLFHPYCQPKPKNYELFREPLLRFTTSTNYFRALKTVINKKWMSAGGKSVALNDMNNSQQQPQPQPQRNIRALTIENYKYNMKRAAEMSVASQERKCADPSTQSTDKQIPFAFQMASLSQGQTTQEIVRPVKKQK